MSGELGHQVAMNKMRVGAWSLEGVGWDFEDADLGGIQIVLWGSELSWAGGYAHALSSLLHVLHCDLIYCDMPQAKIPSWEAATWDNQILQVQPLKL